MGNYKSRGLQLRIAGGWLLFLAFFAGFAYVVGRSL